LAKHAFDGQQTSQPVSPDRPDNLFEPVQGDYAAHGIFGDRAKSVSLQSSLNLESMTLLRHRGLVASAALIAAGLLFTGVRNR
jgi:hypothetical protein